MNEHYDIFISYRRDGGFETAKHLNDLLVRDGYTVSFDIDTLRSGDFDTQLYARIDQCKDFILIVDQHAFDRTLNPNFNPKHDWLRCELAYALKKGKNIVPVFLSGVKSFPSNLPIDIIEVVKRNGPEYNRFYFNDFYKILRKRFLKSRPKRMLGLYSIVLITLVLVPLLLYIFTSMNTSVNSDIVSNETAISKDSTIRESEEIAEKGQKDNDLFHIIEQYVDACDKHHNAYWNLYSTNRSLKALSKNKEYVDGDYYSCKLTYKGIVYYKDSPLSTYDSGEPAEWEITLAGPNACPFMLEICPDSNNWSSCGEEMHENVKEIAQRLHFVLIRERRVIGSYSILYKRGELYYLISETEGSAGATFIVRVILEDMDAIKEYEISEQEIKEDLEFRRKYE